MKKYAISDEVFDIMTTGSFEKLTAQQLIDAYFMSSDFDTQVISICDSEEDAIRCLEKLELCHTRELGFHQGLVHIAFVQQVDVNESNEIVAYGEVVKARVNA